MDCQEFINRLKGVCDEFGTDGPSAERRYAFFLGAGCSVSSDIPSAATLVRDHWIPRLCRIKHPGRKDYEAFAREAFDGYEPDNAAAFYGRLIDELFVTANDRQGEIERLCDGKFPGFGYAALARLVAHKSTAFNVVLTTNFDDLMADALYLYTSARPLVIHHESLATYIRPTRMRPLIVKLHGDSRLSPKNTHAETESLNDDLCKHISMLLNDRGLIFMGYGGGDASIHALLEDLPDEALPSGISWLSRTEPEGAVREWLRKRKGIWVKVTDFDEFMLRAYASFGMKHPSKVEFDKMFGKYYETFRKLGEKIDKPKEGPPDAMLRGVLDAAREALPEGYNEIARGEAMADTQPAEAERLLTDVAKRHGGSVASQLAAARSLRDKLGKHREAVPAFEIALEQAIRESGSNSSEAAIVRSELAFARWTIGDYRQASDDIERSIEWEESQSPRDERLLAICYSNRARIRRSVGNLQGAAEDIQRSIDFEEARFPQDDIALSICYSIRAEIRLYQDDLVRASQDIQRSIDLLQEETPQNERRLSTYRIIRANIRDGLGEFDSALQDIEYGIQWLSVRQPDNHFKLAGARDTEARILAALDRWNDAEQAIAASLEHHERAFGPDHTWTQRARAWQADIAAKRVPPRWYETEPK